MTGLFISSWTTHPLWDLYAQFAGLLAWFGGFIYVGLMAWAAVHALLNKKYIRGAIGWIGLIWFAPVIGIVLYYLFGINRVHRRAKSRLKNQNDLQPPHFEHVIDETELAETIPRNRRNFSSLSSLVGKVTRLPLLKGNSVEPLFGGDSTYESMLESIESAEESISLCTYIFAGKGIGARFADKLIEAHERGVEVRVIVDDVGARYSIPSVTRRLEKGDVPVERFMPTWIPWRFRYINLRNHRKIMVVDGRVGYTGGVNISRLYSSDSSEQPGHDLHFRLRGPIVSHLQYTFAEDWIYCTDEELSGPTWFPSSETHGDILARGLSSGPDDDHDKLRTAMLGAISTAEESIKIVSPYFLPDDELVSALSIASLGDVRVDVVTPEINNSRMVQWASQTALQELADHDVNIHLNPPPFDHTKLMIVDDYWTFLGSANWDARSLKLNFEFNVETYSNKLSGELSTYVDRVIEQSTRARSEYFEDRYLITRIRDNAFRLFSPYL